MTTERDFMGQTIPEDIEWTGNGRAYRASGGNRRNPLLHFIPHPTNPVEVEGGRGKPFSDIRDVRYRFDGRGFRIDFSDVTVIVTGRNLIPVATAILAHSCSFIEAFDPQRRDMPTDKSQSFIETIGYFLPEDDEARRRRQARDARPRHEPETRAKEAEA
jgi:hypothetical protein